MSASVSILSTSRIGCVQDSRQVAVMPKWPGYPFAPSLWGQGEIDEGDCARAVAPLPR